MNFKKFLCCALVLFAVFALAACGGDKVDTYYTVSFDSNGGSDVISQSIKEGEAASAPVEPTKNGYTFAGWYAGENAWDFTAAITADTVLTAKWEKTSYTITYLDTGAPAGTTGAITLTPSTYTIEDATFTLPAPTKEHYNFMGWYLDAECTKNIQSVTTGSFGDLTVYAQFTEKNYGITYVLVREGALNNENNLPSYNINSTFPIVFGAPSLTGFDFLGWYTDANYTTPITQIEALSGDVTVYAKWQESAPVNSYTITYMDGTTPITGLTPTYYVEGSTAVLPIGVKAQHDFEGWYTTATFDEGTKIESITATTTGNLTLYAKFTPNDEPAPTYNVIYMDGTTPITGLAPTTYTAGTAEALPTAEKTNYRFDGWYTTANFADGTKIEAIAVTSTGDLILYAKFTPVTFTITFVLGGGENHPDNEALTEYTVLSTNVLANPTKEGHTFEGWFTDPHYNNSIISLEGKTGDLTIYAKWIQISGSGILTPEHTFGS